MSKQPSSHDALVDEQFGSRAASYVASEVHAQGEDLERLAAWMREARERRTDRRKLDVLDLGCGGGHVSYAVAPDAGRVVAYDPSQAMLTAVAGEAARRGLNNISTQLGRSEQLPFAGASFDLVVSRFSAHHWRALEPGLHEARRVLRASGGAIFIDTVAPEDALLDTWLQTMELMRDASHVRDWSVKEWIEALRVAGFTPAAPKLMRRRMEFHSWTERIATPGALVVALRALQEAAPQEVRRHFALERDGSFQLDVAWLSC